MCIVADHENYVRWIYLTIVLCMGEGQKTEVCEKSGIRQVGPHTVYVFWTISVGPTLTPIYKVAM